MSKLWTVILAMLRAYFSKPPKEDLEKELYELNNKIEKKRLAMSDALNSGFSEHFHVLRREWMQLCKRAGNIRRRLKKD